MHQPLQCLLGSIWPSAAPLYSDAMFGAGFPHVPPNRIRLIGCFDSFPMTACGGNSVDRVIQRTNTRKKSVYCRIEADITDCNTHSWCCLTSAHFTWGVISGETQIALDVPYACSPLDWRCYSTRNIWPEIYRPSFLTVNCQSHGV